MLRGRKIKKVTGKDMIDSMLNRKVSYPDRVMSYDHRPKNRGNDALSKSFRLIGAEENRSLDQVRSRVYKNTPVNIFFFIVIF